MPDLDRLAAVARGLLPAGTGLGWADPARDWPLLSGEDPGSGAVPRRRAEFSAGRAAARMALAGLGLPPMALPAGPDRAPVWPDGVAGSISHSRSACLAAAAWGLSGLGLDLEEDAPLARDLWPEVLLASETAWALAQPDPGRAAKLVFAAKEAAFKAQFPQSRALFGFDTLELSFRADSFRACFTSGYPPFIWGEVVCGRFARAEGHILAAAITRRCTAALRPL